MADEIGKGYGIAEQRVFVDTKGRRVFQFIEEFGKDKGKFVLRGAAMANVQTGDPRQPVRQMQFEFEFPADTTLKKAFELFDEQAKKALDDIQKKQAEQHRIVAAKVMPKILGANGQPMKKE